MANNLTLLGAGISGAGGDPSIWNGTKAVNMDYVDNYVSHDPFWENLSAITDDFTFFCRFEIDAFAGYQTVLGIENQNIPGTPLWIYITASKEVQCSVYGIDGGFKGFRSSINTLTAATKHSLMITWNNDVSAYPRVYVDGSLASGTNQSSGAQGATFDKVTARPTLGARFNATPRLVQPLDGRMCDIAWWYSDQAANASAIHNGGTRHDLTQLASPPSFFAEYGASGDSTAPGTGVLQDTAGTYDGTPTNTVGGDLVTW